jgi:hypothetical protein
MPTHSLPYGQPIPGPQDKFCILVIDPFVHGFSLAYNAGREILPPPLHISGQKGEGLQCGSSFLGASQAPL